MRLADADRGAEIRRLHEDGILERGFDLRDGLARRFLPVGAQQGDVLHDGQAGLGEEALHHVLVHAGGGAEHAGADVGDAGQFEQTLDGAVFAKGAVQDGKNDVEGLAEPTARLPAPEPVLHRLRRQQRGNALVQQLGAGRRLGIAGAQTPRTALSSPSSRPCASPRPASGLPW